MDLTPTPLSLTPSPLSPALSRAPSPALIPARMSTVRRVSASNLPSPVGGFAASKDEGTRRDSKEGGSPTSMAIKRLLGSPPGERGQAKRTLSPLGPKGRSPGMGGGLRGVLAGSGGQEPG